ncbi:MAG: carbohydrate-binding family 9-like protein [Polyangiaceae bacterium]|nr:carbohydrate-binding family 9-like protein [Polyangiaceae bacterium]
MGCRPVFPSVRRVFQAASLVMLAALSGCNADPPRKEAPVDPKNQIKEITAPQINGAALKIDGVLDEEAWSKAAGTGLFVDVGSGQVNAQIPSQGEAKVFWDSTHLYIAFEAYDKTVRGGFPNDAKDPHLWEKDTTEVMIDPDGDGDNKDYYEIQVNPQNLVFDTQYDDYNRPNGGGKGPFGHEEWSFGGEHAVHVHGSLDDDSNTDDGYTVEIKIPWASFTKAKAAPPTPGSSWRMNFYAMQNNGGTGWSPIYGMGNFHKASRFGRVVWATSGASQ